MKTPDSAFEHAECALSHRRPLTMFYLSGGGGESGGYSELEVKLVLVVKEGEFVCGTALVAGMNRMYVGDDIDEFETDL